MGRVNIQSPATAPPYSTLKHFTHPHELHPLSFYTPQTLCSGCKLQSSGIMYTCTPCNFTLHQSCAELPQFITHSSHGGCTLSLLTVTAYPGGVFSCNACSRRGDSWNYHCSRCEYDLHVGCAAKPLKIRHQAHSSCELELTFKNPYMNSDGFLCDSCGKTGSKQWLYRCISCDFDMHMDCTKAPQPMLQHQRSAPPVVAASVHNNHVVDSGGINIHSQYQAPPHAAAGFVRPTPQPHLMHSTSTGAIGNPAYGVNLYNHGPVNTGQPYGSLPGNPQMTVQNNQPPAGGGLGGNMMMAALQGFVEGAFQGVGQTVVQEVIGGGGGDTGVVGDGGDGNISSY